MHFKMIRKALLLSLMLFQSYKLIYGLTCFNCPEISHPRFCNHVQTCDTGQICSIKRTIDIYGDKVFHLGCLDTNLCDRNPTESTSKCYNCCDSDLCNSNGCGEFDARGTNGTMCYECGAYLQSELCHQVSFCDLDEMCYVSEENRFGETFYRSGCKDKNLCHVMQYPYPFIGKRNEMRSTQNVSCCDRNLCNNAAKVSIHSTQSPPILTSTATNSKGMDFLLLFTEGYYLQYATPKALITTQQYGHMSAYYFSNNLNQSLNVVKNMTEYSLNHDVYMTDGLKNAGVELHSNVRTMVYGMSYNNYSGDGYSGGYLAIPSNLLSRNYIISSFKVYNYLSNSMIAVTPTESSTIISLNLKMISGSVTYKNRTFSQNDNLTVVLNKYDTFEISHTSDLTGTLISSTSPVAVVSGNKCNYITHINSKNGCNTFIEMVLPLEQLDTTYIVPYIATRSNSTIRVISVRDGSITVQSNNQVTTKQNRQREFLDFYHDTIAFINATSPVYVLIYPHEIENLQGDAFMMTIHGVNQYLPDYDFVVPSGFTSYISVTVETSGLNGFTLDEQSLSIDGVYTINGSNGSYSSFTIQIASGEHNLKHSKDVKFGVWVYGNAKYDAYGYPAGIAFHTI